MFYDNYVRLCREKGLSRGAVCQAIGLSENAWKRWESGSTPNGKSLKAIADFFGVEPKELMREVEQTETRKDIMDSTEMRVLFDAAKGVPPHKLYEVASQLMKWKEDNDLS